MSQATKLKIVNRFWHWCKWDPIRFEINVHYT